MPSDIESKLSACEPEADIELIRIYLAESSMNTKFVRLILYMVPVLVFTGCMTAWKQLDIAPTGGTSTSDNPVIVRSSKSGMNGLECFVSEPVRTREFKTDAGDLTILVLCYTWGGSIGERADFSVAMLNFVGQAGHTYELVGYSTCMGCGKRSKLGYEYVEIVDRTGGGRIIGNSRLTRCPSEFHCTQQVPAQVPANSA